jgi:hypothetical protein
LISLGVDHIGSVILGTDNWKNPVLNHHDQELLLAPAHENGYALLFTDI